MITIGNRYRVKENRNLVFIPIKFETVTLGEDYRTTEFVYYSLEHDVSCIGACPIDDFIKYTEPKESL